VLILQSVCFQSFFEEQEKKKKRRKRKEKKRRRKKKPLVFHLCLTAFQKWEIDVLYKIQRQNTNTDNCRGRGLTND